MRKGIKNFLENLKFVQNYYHFLRAKTEKNEKNGHREHREHRGFSLFMFEIRDLRIGYERFLSKSPRNLRIIRSFFQQL